MRSRIVAGLATVASVVGMTVLGAVPAHASEKVPSNSCWIDGITGESLCVDAGVDLVAQVLKEKDIRIVAPDGAVIAGKQYSSSSVAQATDVSAQAAYVVSIVYDNINYGGGSTVITGVSTGCTSYSYGYVSLSAIGWSGRVSSFRSYLNCRTAIFDLEYYGGTRYGYTVNASQLGAMNDRADSWRVAR